VGPRAGLDGRKISSPPGLDSDRAVRCQSLYRLSYPLFDKGKKITFLECCAVLQIGRSLVRSQLVSVDFSLT